MFMNFEKMNVEKWSSSVLELYFNDTVKVWALKLRLFFFNIDVIYNAILCSFFSQNSFFYYF